jgi:hypothetical protein
MIDRQCCITAITVCSGTEPGDELDLDGHAVGAENLCHQAILVNHAYGAVAPPGAEMVQVGDAIGQRAKRRGLVQGAVRPVSVVEVLVLA